MQYLRIILYAPLAITRLIFFFFFTGFMLYRVKIFIHLKKHPQQFAFKVLQQWSATTLFLMGIRIEWKNKYDFPTPSILMANHRSYIDPLIVFSVYPAVIIAKKELGSWPIIGSGLRLLNCLLVDRKNVKNMIETIHKTEQAVNKIGRLVVFPEGTTTAGPLTKNFKAGTFHVAAKNQFPIIPLAMDFKDPKLAWVGNDYFVFHFITKMGKPINRVKVCIGNPLILSDEKELAKKTKLWMDEKLLEMRVEWDN